MQTSRRVTGPAPPPPPGSSPSPLIALLPQLIATRNSLTPGGPLPTALSQLILFFQTVLDKDRESPANFLCEFLPFFASALHAIYAPTFPPLLPSEGLHAAAEIVRHILGWELVRLTSSDDAGWRSPEGLVWVRCVEVIMSGILTHLDDAADYDPKNGLLVTDQPVRTTVGQALIPLLASIVSPAATPGSLPAPPSCKYQAFDMIVEVISKHVPNKDLARTHLPATTISDILKDGGDRLLSIPALEIGYRLLPPGPSSSQATGKGSKSTAPSEKEKWTSTLFPKEKFGSDAAQLCRLFTGATTKAFAQSARSILDLISLGHLNRAQPFRLYDLFHNSISLWPPPFAETSETQRPTPELGRKDHIDFWIGRDNVASIVGTDDYGKCNILETDVTTENHFSFLLADVVKVEVDQRRVEIDERKSADELTVTISLRCAAKVGTTALPEDVKGKGRASEITSKVVITLPAGDNVRVLRKSLSDRVKTYPKLNPIMLVNGKATHEDVLEKRASYAAAAATSRRSSSTTSSTNPVPSKSKTAPPPPKAGRGQPKSSSSSGRRASQAGPVAAGTNPVSPPDGKEGEKESEWKGGQSLELEERREKLASIAEVQAMSSATSSGSEDDDELEEERGAFKEEEAGGQRRRGEERREDSSDEADDEGAEDDDDSPGLAARPFDLTSGKVPPLSVAHSPARSKEEDPASDDQPGRVLAPDTPIANDWSALDSLPKAAQLSGDESSDLSDIEEEEEEAEVLVQATEDEKVDSTSEGDVKVGATSEEDGSAPSPSPNPDQSVEPQMLVPPTSPVVDPPPAEPLPAVKPPPAAEPLPAAPSPPPIPANNDSESTRDSSATPAKIPETRSSRKRPSTSPDPKPVKKRPPPRVPAPPPPVSPHATRSRAKAGTTTAAKPPAQVPQVTTARHTRTLSSPKRTSKKRAPPSPVVSSGASSNDEDKDEEDDNEPTLDTPPPPPPPKSQQKNTRKKAKVAFEDVSPYPTRQRITDLSPLDPDATTATTLVPSVHSPEPDTLEEARTVVVVRKTYGKAGKGRKGVERPMKKGKGKAVEEKTQDEDEEDEEEDEEDEGEEQEVVDDSVVVEAVGRPVRAKKATEKARQATEAPKKKPATKETKATHGPKKKPARETTSPPPMSSADELQSMLYPKTELPKRKARGTAVDDSPQAAKMSDPVPHPFDVADSPKSKEAPSKKKIQSLSQLVRTSPVAKRSASPAPRPNSPTPPGIDYAEEDLNAGGDDYGAHLIDFDQPAPAQEPEMDIDDDDEPLGANPALEKSLSQIAAGVDSSPPVLDPALDDSFVDCAVGDDPKANVALEGAEKDSLVVVNDRSREGGPSAEAPPAPRPFKTGPADVAVVGAAEAQKAVQEELPSAKKEVPNADKEEVLVEDTPMLGEALVEDERDGDVAPEAKLDESDPSAQPDPPFAPDDDEGEEQQQEEEEHQGEVDEEDPMDLVEETDDVAGPSEQAPDRQSNALYLGKHVLGPAMAVPVGRSDSREVSLEGLETLEAEQEGNDGDEELQGDVDLAAALMGEDDTADSAIFVDPPLRHSRSPSPEADEDEDAEDPNDENTAPTPWQAEQRDRDPTPSPAPKRPTVALQPPAAASKRSATPKLPSPAIALPLRSILSKPATSKRDPPADPGSPLTFDFLFPPRRAQSAHTGATQPNLATLPAFPRASGSKDPMLAVPLPQPSASGSKAAAGAEDGKTKKKHKHRHKAKVTKKKSTARREEQEEQEEQRGFGGTRYEDSDEEEIAEALAGIMEQVLQQHHDRSTAINKQFVKSQKKLDKKAKQLIKKYHTRTITFLATIDDHVAFLDKSLDKLLAAFGPPPP